MTPRPRGLGTRAVHDDAAPGEGSLVTPIAQTSTFVARDTQTFDDLYDGRAEGYVYSRYANPTNDAAARRIAALEGGEACVLAASGMAAITAVMLAHAKPGGRVLSVEDTYGGTAGLFNRVLRPMGVKVETFPTGDAKALDRLLLAGPADLVYLESPTNPTLRLVPLSEAAEVARRHDVPTAIDSTFASPINSRPLEHGIDVVIHSATKYLAGHSDVTAGAIVGSRDVVDRVNAIHKTTGGMLDPHAAFLLERGLKTVHLRVREANRNAQAVAEHLASHPKVARVHYPGLPAHAQHDLARAQMPGGFGGLLSFDLPGGKPAAARFVDRLRLIRNAASLGGVESLASIPVVHSHRGLSAEALARSGITPGTVRLALGIEDKEDLIADVEQALAHV